MKDKRLQPVIMLRHRRALLRFILGASISVPLRSLAQHQKPIKIGYLANTVDPRKSSSTFHSFVNALKSNGWIEGKNIEIHIKSSGGRDELFRQLAAEFVTEKVDILITTGTASTRAAAAATSTIPIVFGSAANPVEQNLVASLPRPGNNITGVARLVEQLGPKRLQLLCELLPKATRITRFYSGVTIIGMQPAIIKDYDVAAQALGITLQHVPLTSAGELAQEFTAAARRGTHAVIVEAEAMFTVNRAEVARLALANNLPLMSADARFADAGALIAYSDSITAQYARAGQIVDKILRGSKPADIPVELPSVFELVVNEKSAAALGVTIPHSILVRASRVIKY